jgi:hypothetical protein
MGYRIASSVVVITSQKKKARIIKNAVEEFMVKKILDLFVPALHTKNIETAKLAMATHAIMPEPVTIASSVRV